MNQDLVTIYNGGRNVRHFTYIDDVVEGLIYAYGCNLPLINIANPEKTSVREYAFALDNALREARTLNFGGIGDILTTCNFVPEIREKDRLEQSIDTRLPIVPMDYTTVHDGLLKVAIDYYDGKK